MAHVRPRNRLLNREDEDMSNARIYPSKRVAVLLAACWLASSPAASYAQYEWLQDFQALLSGVIAEERETNTGNHIMKVEGEMQLLDSMVRGELTLSLQGHHGQPEAAVSMQNQSPQPECVPAAGTGKFVTPSGIIRFSQAGTVCLKVPGINKPETHLYDGTYYITGGTGIYKRAFGSGSLNGSFDSDVENTDPSKKRVVLKFDGAISQ